LFAVAAAAWVTDRLADPRRVGEAQVLVGAALVLGSALGPALASLVVGSLRYRDTFGLLAGVGAAATALVLVFVPETAGARAQLFAQALSTPPPGNAPGGHDEPTASLGFPGSPSLR
jgi:predicted MFS family arabinose efflux permease